VREVRNKYKIFYENSEVWNFGVVRCWALRADNHGCTQTTKFKNSQLFIGFRFVWFNNLKLVASRIWNCLFIRFGIV